VIVASESARMASAAEARYRIQAPNSRPRSIRVVALDARSESLLARVARDRWAHAEFLTAAASDDGAVSDLAGRRRDLAGEVRAADLVVMVATPGGHAHAADAIGRACRLANVTATALVVGADGAPDEAVSRTLAQVRPWALMLVVANPPDYIDDMLAALRA
jgi:hypothetical protein